LACGYVVDEPHRKRRTSIQSCRLTRRDACPDLDTRHYAAIHSLSR